MRPVTAFDATAAAATIQAALQASANPERANVEQRYLKSDLAFLGTGVPAVHRAVSAFLKASPSVRRDGLLATASQLWESPCHEHRLSAVFLLDAWASLLLPEDLPVLESMLREARTWALVDELATGPVNTLVVRHPAAASELDRWVIDPDFWVRRAALLVLLRPLREGGGDWDRFARYADAMLGEREFFIRKAIGWVLRDVSKKRPRLVADWLLPRVHRASGVTVREAVRYLDQADRDAILAAYRARSDTPRPKRHAAGSAGE